MKRNFDEQILGLDGEPVRLGMTVEVIARAIATFLSQMTPEQTAAFNAILDKQAKKPLTFGASCVTVLMGAYQDESGLPLPERAKRMELAIRINKGGVQEITPEDRDMIKPLLIKGFMGILIPVVCAELLEKDAPKPLPEVADVKSLT